MSGEPEINPDYLVRTDEWSLDLLGNWVGSAEAKTSSPSDGRETTGDLDWGGMALPPPSSQTPTYDPPRGVEFSPDYGEDDYSWMHTVDPRNEIDQIDQDLDGQAEQHTTEYDAAGNLTFDGEY